MGLTYHRSFLLVSILVALAQVSIAAQETVPLYGALETMAASSQNTSQAVNEKVNEVMNVVSPTAIPSTGPIGEVVIGTMDTVNSTVRDGPVKNVTMTGLETLLTVLTTLRCAGGRCEIPTDASKDVQDPVALSTPEPTAPSTVFTTKLYGSANGPTIPPTRIGTSGATLGSTEFEPQAEGEAAGFNWWPVIYAAIGVGGFISLSVVIGLGIKARRQRLAGARRQPVIGEDLA